MKQDIRVEDRRAVIEGRQHPDRGGFDSMTIEELMDWFHVPGMSLAVIESFAIVWAKGYGRADVKNGSRVDTETLFQAGSISKPVAVMAMLKAVQEGRFELDEDINGILKSWRLPDSGSMNGCKVTPRMLASHIAGLGDGFGFPGYEPGLPLPNAVQTLDGLPPSNGHAVRLERPPQTAMKYSGGGSTILQLAMTDVLGRSFDQILRESVLDPLEMTNSTFEQPLSEARDRRAARGHDIKGDSMGPKFYVHPELFAAGLWSTPTDLAKFGIEVQLAVQNRSDRVLVQSIAQEMVNPVGIGDFAVGFRVERRGQGWYVHHGGRTQGYSCLLYLHRLQGYGLAIMTNASDKMAFIEEIKERVERAYEWDSLDKALPR